jgi:hypothetical protein
MAGAKTFAAEDQPAATLFLCGRTIPLNMTVLALITQLKPLYKKIHPGSMTKLCAKIAVPVDIAYNYQGPRSAAR